MHFQKLNRISRVVGALLLMNSVCASAVPISLGNMIQNGEFQTNLDFWTTSGTVNRRLVGNTINTSGGNAGFNSFFGSSFAVLGDISGAIGNDPNSGIASLSQTFVLPGIVSAGAVQTYDLLISFRTVFDGRDDGTNGGPNANDDFSATLSSTTLFSQNSGGFPANTPSTSSPNNQLVNNPFSTTLFGLVPGSYTLTFTLNEKSSGSFTNTAAGVDSVSAFATAHLSVPEPGTLALLGIAIAALGVSRCSRQSARVRA